MDFSIIKSLCNFFFFSGEGEECVLQYAMRWCASALLPGIPASVTCRAGIAILALLHEMIVSHVGCCTQPHLHTVDGLTILS